MNMSNTHGLILRSVWYTLGKKIDKPCRMVSRGSHMLARSISYVIKGCQAGYAPTFLLHPQFFQKAQNHEACETISQIYIYIYI